MKKITSGQIKSGIRNGTIRLIIDPAMGSGTVCQIGEHWSYFGGLTAEEEYPEEYQKNVSEEDIVREITEALGDFREPFPEEYLYYYCILRESGC